jgi:hypothetical protein
MTKRALVWNAPDHIPNDYEKASFSNARYPAVAISNEQIGQVVCPTVVLVARMVASKSVGHPTHTVAELQQQIHDDLRRQHPEWVEPSGESPMCDFYEARLSQLLQTCVQSSLAKVA